MSKLALFRQIGEAMAHTMDADIIGGDDIAFSFFHELAIGMYPSNTTTRHWAETNMQMFYDQENERIKIMKALSGVNNGVAIIDAIEEREKAERRQQEDRSHIQ